jgi:hypothetical protein
VPGGSGAFSFDSPLPPELSSFQVAGIDSSGNFLTNDGMILTASVPEPASALLLTAGVVGVLVVARRSKRARPARTAR